MSGSPIGGYENSKPTLFDGANLVYISTEKTRENDFERLHTVLSHLGFSSHRLMDKTTHDEYIAHTSQLTHLISSALVLSNNGSLPKEVMGNSYRDLSRIADIEPDMWSELFLANKDALTKTLDDFQDTLANFKTLLKSGDTEALKTKLEKTRLRFRQNN